MISQNIKRKTATITLFFLLLLLFIFALNYLFPLNTDRLNKPKSTLIYDVNNHLMALKLSPDGFLRMPIKKDDLNSNVKKIVLAYEDQHFEEHFGVNPFSILRALWFNLSSQKKIGASTITMQVARMMHHEPRTFGQKLIEMFQSFQLEWYYSKDEILTFYLNNAPYGGNIEGFASASFKYFQLPVSSLSLSQIAYLTSIPKNPNANRPRVFKNGKHRDLNNIKNRLLKRIKNLKLLNEEAYERAKLEKISVKIQNLPNKIPQLSNQIKKQGEVHTTINMQVQEQVQKLLAQRIDELKGFNIHNAAAIVIENKSMDIVAYVASANFHDKHHGGENNGLTALVSPGSTLKPFVYARALEQGLITPLKKIFDVPLFIDGYKPMNYSKTYVGEVTATEALQLSLNIPAVVLDQLLKEKSLYQLLKQTEVSSLSKPKSYYGSSLTLGGFGLSLKENAELFAMLANGGMYETASYLKQREPKTSVTNNARLKPKRLLSKEATYLVSNILADAPRLSFSATWEQMKSMSRIAFKTGTSAHAKDMLTIGYTPKYTVAVWYGNFSGAASKKYQGVSATGLKIASPTLFKIFKILGKQTWFQKPKGITSKNICQDAIQIGACQEQVQDQIIESVKPKLACKILRAEVLAYLQKQGSIKSISTLKEHDCYIKWKAYKPLITSPTHNKTYSFNALLPQALKKTKLECFSFEDNSTVYWLIDNKQPIVSSSGEALYQYLSPTVHDISCVDEGAKVRKIRIFNEEL